MTIAQAPGRVYTAMYDAQEERVSYLFTNNNVSGVGMEIARLTHFYDFFAEGR